MEWYNFFFAINEKIALKDDFFGRRLTLTLRRVEVSLEALQINSIDGLKGHEFVLETVNDLDKEWFVEMKIARH